MSARPPHPVAAVALAGVLALTGCGGSSASSSDAASSAAASGSGELTGTLTVAAAASLTDVFPELGDRLERSHPGLEVQFSFAGSSALAAQVIEGAPVDVLASADEVQMGRVEDEGLVAEAEVFAENALMLVVPVANPAGVTLPPDVAQPNLSDLVSADMTVAVCAPEVPCGAAAAEVLEVAGLSDAPDTYEDDVRAVLAKVELGEVDAGLVYLSDAHAAEGTVLGFAFSEAPLAINRYPIGVLTDSPNAAAAQAFVDLVLSPAGQRVLADAGFLPPS